MQSLFILGRQPALGLAEIESLYRADKIRKVGQTAAVLDVEPRQVDFSRLGGTVKFCKVLTTLDTTAWQQIEKFLKTAVPKHAALLPEGKMRLGLSVYGLNVPVKQVNATGLELKKVIRSKGRSVRVIQGNELFLNSAQVLHNQLTGQLGWELIFVRNGNKTILAQNIAEQDIEAYTARDQKRPKRDARVGMLPPKLAQIIINLAVGQVKEQSESYLKVRRASTGGSDAATRQEKERVTSFAREQVLSPVTILDPFCGTGVILQEAALMGYNVYGTDIEQRMVDYSRANLDWLQNTYNLEPITYNLLQADATSYTWTHDSNFIASETYLGRPFTSSPDHKTLTTTINDCNTITKKFLGNVAKQTKAGFRMCLAVPTWRIDGNFKHLPLLDSLTDMGYTRLSFVHVKNEDLIYYREDQIVARELLVLERK